MDKAAFAKMKKTCIFLNLGRGPIVVEQDLYEALENDEIAAAGLDVLCQEPMSETNPLRKIKDSKKLLITPHVAWAECRSKDKVDGNYTGTDKRIFSNLRNRSCRMDFSDMRQLRFCLKYLFTC